jgi:hypothetical protein
MPTTGLGTDRAGTDGVGALMLGGTDMPACTQEGEGVSGPRNAEPEVVETHSAWVVFLERAPIGRWGDHPPVVGSARV